MAVVNMDEPRAGRSRHHARRWALLIALGALVSGVYLSGVWRYLSLDELAGHRQMLRAWATVHPILAVACFASIYAVVVLASVPGATVMTLAGGFVFGVWLGAASALAGANAGAFGVYLLARKLLAGPLARRVARHGSTVKRLADGFRRDAFFYLLSLRLMPVVPFWLVNIAAGLGGASPRAFVAATLLGAAPATIVYSAIGAGLGETFAAGRTPRLSGLMSPGLVLPLMGLALLSLAPVIARRRRSPRHRRRDPFLS